MGHLIFVALHVVAILFGFALLMLTIPAHLIYGAVKSRNAPQESANAPTPRSHVKCPDCRELVQKEANVCKHCGCKLAPQK
jgi:hypothetical protein